VDSDCGIGQSAVCSVDIPQPQGLFRKDVYCVMVHECPPNKEEFIQAYATLGIELPDDPLKWMTRVFGFLMRKYADKPEFDESFYTL